jgi:hypothetical protein
MISKWLILAAAQVALDYRYATPASLEARPARVPAYSRWDRGHLLFVVRSSMVRLVALAHAAIPRADPAPLRFDAIEECQGANDRVIETYGHGHGPCSIPEPVGR